MQWKRELVPRFLRSFPLCTRCFRVPPRVRGTRYIFQGSQLIAVMYSQSFEDKAPALDPWQMLLNAQNFIYKLLIRVQKLPTFHQYYNKLGKPDGDWYRRGCSSVYPHLYPHRTSNLPLWWIDPVRSSTHLVDLPFCDHKPLHPRITNKADNVFLWVRNRISSLDFQQP